MYGEIGYYSDRRTVKSRTVGKYAYTHSGICLLYTSYPQVDQAAIDILHQQNIFCGVWSVDDTEPAQKYIDYGVDFIVTNEIPARINHMVNDLSLIHI